MWRNYHPPQKSSSVADLDLNPDLYIFGPPGSGFGSISQSQRYGTRSTPKCHGSATMVGGVLRFFCSRRNWDPPPPPSPGSGGRAHTLAREGLGESQFRRGDIHYGTLYIYVLWATPPPFPTPIPKGLSDGFHALKFVTRNYSGEYNFVTPLYTPERGTKIFFKQLLFVIMNLDTNFWFYTGFNF